jgi:hypothetical protein
MRDITVDKSWVLACDSESKHRYNWNVTPKEKVVGYKIPTEVHAACFFYNNFGVVHHEFIHVGQTVGSASFLC